MTWFRQPQSSSLAEIWIFVHLAALLPSVIGGRYGADMPVLEWRERLVCGECGGRRVDMVE
jgi:hypothetical protein